MTLDAETTDRAGDVNARLVRSWMIREGVADGPLPSLRDVSLDEAISASKEVAARAPERLPSGGVSIMCHVEPTRVPRLYAWAIIQGVHANG